MFLKIGPPGGTQLGRNIGDGALIAKSDILGVVSRRKESTLYVIDQIRDDGDDLSADTIIELIRLSRLYGDVIDHSIPDGSYATPIKLCGFPGMPPFTRKGFTAVLAHIPYEHVTAEPPSRCLRKKIERERVRHPIDRETIDSAPARNGMFQRIPDDIT